MQVNSYVFSGILQSVFMENLFQLGSCSSDSTTRVVLKCFRTKKFELFSLFYMIPDDLELTVVKGRRMWIY